MHNPKTSILAFTILSISLGSEVQAQDKTAPPSEQEIAPSANQQSEPQPPPTPQFNRETKPTQEPETAPPPPPDFNRETKPTQAPETAPPPPSSPPDPVPYSQSEANESRAKEPPREFDDYAEPEPEEDDGFEMPSFSIRLDPLNWLIEGRLGLELEVAVWKFISFEMVPVFVVNDAPPIFNFAGEPDNLTQHSNGLGPISGSSFGVGFWLSGTALQEGTVLRLIFTNYGYTYKTDGGDLDRVDFTERRLYGMIGSISRWGIFTIGTGFGLGVELNQKQRCIEEIEETGEDSVRVIAQTSGCSDDGEQRIAVKFDRDTNAINIYDINGWLHPIYITARISLGITLDFD